MTCAYSRGRLSLMDWSGWTRQIVRLRRQSERWRRLAAERGRSRDMWKERARAAEWALQQKGER
jgi:hypothetical protein